MSENGNGNDGNGSALESGLNLLSLLFGEEKARPARNAVSSGKRAGDCRCDGRRKPVPLVFAKKP